MLADPYAVVPFTVPVNATVHLPGSKSITNRAMLLAALADGTTTITGALFSEDTEIMAECLRRLGFDVREDKARSEIQITGQGGNIPAKSADLFVGLAGTAARFITALCCLAQSGRFQIDGVPQMRKRPMKSLLDALESLGARIKSDNGHFPITIEANGLRGGNVALDATESSQLLSALLMVAPLAEGPIQIEMTDGGYRREYVTMTWRMMCEFGQPATKILENGLLINPPASTPYRSGTQVYQIEPDASAASYFLALPYVTSGRIFLQDFIQPSLQGDINFWHAIDQFGASVVPTPKGTECSFYRVQGSTEHISDKFDTYDFHAISDTFLTLAAIAPLKEGATHIHGIAHTRKQETDRVSAMATELRKLGQVVDEENDSLTIHPRLLQRAEIETYGDHRIAMSFAVLGCYDLNRDGVPWLAIKNPGVCAKTFPNFFKTLESIRPKSAS